MVAESILVFGPRTEGRSTSCDGPEKSSRSAVLALR